MGRLLEPRLDPERARLEREGVRILTPLETEPWGERFFQVADPNGVVVQFVQWVEAGDSVRTPADPDHERAA
jgi:uncharacterized glyoxalase superfamily protein PhnB